MLDVNEQDLAIIGFRDGCDFAFNGAREQHAGAAIALALASEGAVIDLDVQDAGLF